MATAQNKWYSFGAAKRPRRQEQKPCDIGGMGLWQAAVIDHNCVGVMVHLMRQREDDAGYSETFTVCLTNDEIDRIVRYRDELVAKYGKGE